MWLSKVVARRGGCGCRKRKDRDQQKLKEAFSTKIARFHQEMDQESAFLLSEVGRLKAFLVVSTPVRLMIDIRRQRHFKLQVLGRDSSSGYLRLLLLNEIV